MLPLAMCWKALAKMGFCEAAGVCVMARYASFTEFYPDYLNEHVNRFNRRLHFVGSAVSLIVLSYALVARVLWPMPVAFLIGYGCAWIGHFFFENNKPATFAHPVYSFVGDWVMFKDILSGRIRW